MNKVAMVLKIILLLAIIGVIGFVAYSCFFNKDDGVVKTDPGAPSADVAPFKLTVRATGNIYYAKIMVTTGTVMGQRTFTLNRYYEQVGGKYTFKEATVILRETDFGEITAERRK